MKSLLALALLLVSGGAMAQTTPPPSLYDVAGVAAGDVLNIRTAPSAAAEQVGALPPDATRVEVVALSENARWGMVNRDGMAGWVSMAYLAASDTPAWWEMAAPLFCYGTEPFWNATLDPSGASQLERMGKSPADLTLDWVTPAWGNADWDRPYSIAMTVSSAGQSGIGVIRAESCNDGMSDQEFALRIQMFLQTGQTATDSFGGCCTMEAN